MLAVTGCPGLKPIEAEVRKKPRPIEVMTLSLAPPPTSALVSASVASWKTEEIGFEVAGRVKWVIEPGEEVEGRLVDELIEDEEKRVLLKGTPIAKLESEKYQLQVEIAQAEVSRAEQNVKALKIELNQSLPAQERAAIAERSLAETELARSEALVAENAGAKADVDRDQARYENAVSQIQQVKAKKEAKGAELQAAKLQVAQAKQNLRDARRSLGDCVLYSSFRGQIASVDVVSGSVVTAGQPVATIQMMDPIKVELEVSAEDSRRLRKRQRLPLQITNAEGNIEPKDGYLYLIDPTADPQTRTYTLTLLMLNERNVVEGEAQEVGLPFTDQTWRLDFSFLPGADDGKLYVPEEAIRQDADGKFLWRTNMKVSENLPEDNIVSVSKLRIDLTDSKVPFLGNWDFQEIVLKDDSFDPKVNTVIGKLWVSDGEPDNWDGEQVLVSRDAQWKVRPGDLVRVDLSDGNATPGIFVPMDAIAREAGKSFVFIVEGEGTETKVSRLEVAASELDGSLSSLLRIEPIDGDSSSLSGKQIATQGVHYLRDGESVLVSNTEANL